MLLYPRYLTLLSFSKYLKVYCKKFTVDTLDGHYLNCILFSDEAIFHVTGHVHCDNVRLWASEYPHAYVEYERNSPSHLTLGA